METIAKVLIAASAPFFFVTAFEMYLLTAIRGPQMIGFSMAHVAPGFLILIMLSGVFYVCLGVFTLVLLIMKLLGRLAIDDRYTKWILVVFAIQMVHTSLLLTYDYWSAVFARGG